MLKIYNGAHGNYHTMISKMESEVTLRSKSDEGKKIHATLRGGGLHRRWRKLQERKTKRLKDE